MSRTRMTILPFILLPLSPFVIFDNDYALLSCPLCTLNTLLNIFMILGRNVEQGKTTNIFMILGRNVEQGETTCCLQE